MCDNKDVRIEAFEGGYLVDCGGKKVVTTSLGKAIKMVREYLAGGSEAEES